MQTFIGRQGGAFGKDETRSCRCVRPHNAGRPRVTFWPKYCLLSATCRLHVPPRSMPGGPEGKSGGTARPSPEAGVGHSSNPAQPTRFTWWLMPLHVQGLTLAVPKACGLWAVPASCARKQSEDTGLMSGWSLTGARPPGCHPHLAHSFRQWLQR